MVTIRVFLGGALLALGVAGQSGTAMGDAGHGAADDNGHQMEMMKQMHRGHAHEHDFEAMDEMTPEQMRRVMRHMREIGLALPPMDAQRGRKLFAQTGCVVCHAVNGIGGDIGPALNAADMPQPMNAFEFAARMWRGAAAMTAMQEAELGGVIELSGQDLADLVAFAHDEDEQKKLSLDQVPETFRKKLAQ